MPRPKLHSDEFVLDTALKVLLRKGPSAFTLSDVADEVGISRAALIQRFADKSNLHRRVMERLTQEVRDYFAGADLTKGLDAMWSMLKDLIGGMGNGPGTEGYLLLLWADTQDASLRALAAERNRLVRVAIQSRLPEKPHAAAPTASLIQAVLQGACMQWLVEPKGELSTFMIEQVRRILILLYPKHAFR